MLGSTIVSVEPHRITAVQCISVSHHLGLYITNDYIVTHNSALALNICQHITLHAKTPLPVALFSLEMNAPSILTRMICSRGRVDQHKFRAAYVNQDERRRLQLALDDIIESPLLIFDKFGISMPEISKHIKWLVKNKGVKLVVIDYLQLIAPARKGENRNLEVGDMTRRLKVLAGDCGIPIVLLSQLSRRNEQRPGGQLRPMLSDLRDSGSIEQDADSVWFLFREELHRKDREDLKGLAELIIAKQRNGPVGTVNLMFLGQFTLFTNKADDNFPEERSTTGEAPPAPSGADW